MRKKLFIGPTCYVIDNGVRRELSACDYYSAGDLIMHAIVTYHDGTQERFEMWDIERTDEGEAKGVTRRYLLLEDFTPEQEQEP